MTMRALPPLSLHHLTFLETSPNQLIDIAAAERCEHVCLFADVPADFRHLFPLIDTEAKAREVRRHLDGEGMSLWNLEVIFIDPAVPPRSHRRLFEIGAIMGARGATVSNAAKDAEAAAQWLGELGELAREYNMPLGLEWHSASETRTMAAAVELVRKSGCDNAKLTIDSLHWYRNGGTVAEVAALRPEDVAYVQLSDGPAHMPDDKRWEEMIDCRAIPGEGEFPLGDFLDALPTIPVLSIEVPQKHLADRCPPAQRAGKIVAATRALLSKMLAD